MQTEPSSQAGPWRKVGFCYLQPLVHMTGVDRASIFAIYLWFSIS